MAQIKGLCKQQAYQFQSGCAATCGPESLAFARDSCIATLGCDPLQCQFLNSTTSTSVVINVPVAASTPAPTPGAWGSCLVRGRSQL